MKQLLAVLRNVFRNILKPFRRPGFLAGCGGLLSITAGIGWRFHPSWALIFFGAILLLLAAKKR